MSKLVQLLPLAALAVACAHKPPEATPEKEAPVAAQTPSPSPTPATVASLQCVSDADCKGDMLCASGTCTDASALINACGEVRVHFAFDSATIAETDFAPLERVARCLRSHQKVGISIEGNADDRGTEEYNLALGDRRANAVAGYLEKLGLSRTQLQTISYGEARPICTDETEACWSQNRRAAVVPKKG
ncbi:MAG: OmpA family protein [Myxococcota bacterium]